jgi:RNA polymerase sigma-70 factor, ECF subfamily
MHRPKDAGMETEWIERARQGDEQAFQWLIDAHKDSVFRLAYLMLKNTEDAEDITQETFWRAYHHLHRFDTTRPFKPWVLRIAANLCRNQRRDLRRYWNALWALAKEDEDKVSVERQVMQNVEVSAMLDAIRHLRPDEQEIIYLRYFLELDVATTAEVLNVQPGTVKSRLHRALKQLEFVIQREFPMLAEEQHS